MEYIKKVENNEFKVEIRHYHEFQEMIIEDLWGYELDDILTYFPGDETNENAEFVLKINDHPSLVIELKGQGVDLDKRQGKNYRYRTPIEQARDYAYNTYQVEWYIVSNYEEIRLYNYHEKRKYVSFNVRELKENNYELLKPFIFCFSKKSHSKGLMKELAKESSIAEIKFRKDFYKLYDATRRMLIRELEEENNLNRQESIKYAQLILNRYLFICFGQYRGLLPYQITIKTISRVIDDRDLRDQEIWHKMNLLFSDINIGNDRKGISKFNGGLFAEDLSFIKIRDEINDANIFSDIIQDWDFDEYPVDIELAVNPYSRTINQIYKNLILIASFDFSQQLNVNILGNIFENSLSDLEDLKEGDELGVRKDNGIYYTPEYITDFVCRHTIIPFLSKSGKETTVDGLIKEYSDSIEDLDKKVKNIKVIDPSCGSGAFLNKASDILLEIHEAIYFILYDKDSKLTKLFDSIEERSDILIKNIYGVDLNEESVDLTKLSLFLNIFKNEDKAAILPCLDDNIKCGNSIINDSDISDTPFDWKGIFPFKFDIVIGNPPHGAKFSEAEKSYIDENYELNKNHKSEKHYESCKLFFEVAKNIVAEKNLVSYVIPKSFTYNSSWEDSRHYFFNKSQVEYCVDLGVAFKDVKHEQVFLQVSFGETNSEYSYLGGYLEEKKQILRKIPIDLSKKYHIMFANLTGTDIKIGYILYEKQYPKFEGIFDVFRGFGSSYVDKNGTPAFAGKNVHRYYHDKPSNKIVPTASKSERMKKDKVITQRIVAHVTNPTDKLYIQSTVADNSILNMETVTNIISKEDNISNLFIAGLLNSKFLGWYIYRFIYNKAIRNIDFDLYYVNKIVLPFGFKESSVQTLLIDKVKENIKIMGEINSIRSSFLKYLELEFNLKNPSQKIIDYFKYPDELEKEMKNKRIRFTPRKIEDLEKKLEESLLRLNPKLLKFDNNIKDINNKIFEIYGLKQEYVDIILNETRES